MSNRRTLIVWDTETTGLDANPGVGNEITEIAAIAINPWDLQEHHAGRFQMFVKPKRPELMSAKAMQVSGDSFKKAMAEGVEPKVAFQAFLDFCGKANDQGLDSTKPLLCGHNEGFDRRMFIAGALEHKVIKSADADLTFDYHSIDTWTLAFLLFESDPSVHNLTLNTFLEKLGMSRQNNTHGAMEDVELTLEALRRSLYFFRRCRKAMKVVTVAEAQKTNQAFAEQQNNV